MAASWLGYGWFGIRPGDKAIRFWGQPLGPRRRLRFAAADFTTLSTSTADFCGKKRRIAIASGTDLPRTVSNTNRAFRADTGNTAGEVPRSLCALSMT